MFLECAKPQSDPRCAELTTRNLCWTCFLTETKPWEKAKTNSQLQKKTYHCGGTAPQGAQQWLVSFVFKLTLFFLNGFFSPQRLSVTGCGGHRDHEGSRHTMLEYIPSMYFMVEGFFFFLFPFPLFSAWANPILLLRVAFHVPLLWHSRHIHHLFQVCLTTELVCLFWWSTGLAGSRACRCWNWCTRKWRT